MFKISKKIGFIPQFQQRDSFWQFWILELQKSQGTLGVKIHKERFSKQNLIKCYLCSSLKLVILDALMHI